MKYLVVLILFSCFYGCQDAPSPSVVGVHETEPVSEATESAVETIAAEPTIAVEPTPGRTFAKLRTEFPGQMLDAEFKTLQNLVGSKTYLAFLSHHFSADTPYQTFEGFLQAVPLLTERYVPFLKAELGIAEELDITVIHSLTSAFRNAAALEYHGVAPEKVETKRVEALANEQVANWAVLRFGNDDALVGQLDGKRWVKFIVSVQLFASETERADVTLVEAYLKNHGKNEGLIWLALDEPALVGQLLTSFTDPDVFLRWVAGEFHAPDNFAAGF